MSRFSGGVGMPNHIIVIAEVPGPDGLYPVRCIPHGPRGAWPTHLEAFIRACEHDDRYGKDWQ